ncbi:putative tetrahydrofolylpolyglutamate synthase [Cadophora sp. MPI-SDFR-AT-0126]|nr:putative tetrahydrofolylpolyglutamate synthase [Leotiomycetes sp. MPI-SDFR-AT-0126]
MDKSYQRAIALLNGRRRGSRPSTESVKSIPESSRMPTLPGKPDLKGTPSILGMKHWLGELGHSSASINSLNIIHIAGTKGKGSTCAFIDSFMRAHGKRTGYPQKVGLYTSPHLVDPEERIRINFEPLPRDLFAKYTFEVDDLLSRSGPREFTARPGRLQFFALLAFHTFISEGVDAAIFETHHGGEYDSTNFIEKPVVTAITTLGLDHVQQLGSSIESIAWHKAGIFKTGATAFSVPQESTAAEVLRTRASQKGVNLQFVDIDPSLPTDIVQLKPDVQRTNCSVALAAVRSFLEQKDHKSRSSLSASDIIQGISQFSWPGRFQIMIKNQYQWFLDGAHNEMSVSVAAKWFLETSKMQTIKSAVARILIFSHITDHRDAAAVFERLATSLVNNGIQYVIFTTYERGQDTDAANIMRIHLTSLEFPLLIQVSDPQPEIPETPSQDQQNYATIWRKIQPDTSISFQPTIKGALELARKIGEYHGSVQTLITGSLHLVGGALSLLQTTKTSEVPETGNETRRDE